MDSSMIAVMDQKEDLTDLVARKARAGKRMVLSFGDFCGFLEELLSFFYKPGSRLVSAGPVTPEIELAASHAEVDLIEANGASPFSADIDCVLSASGSPSDIIYVANPNRVTGAGMAVADLERLARAVPQSPILIDEYYFDHYGITGFPLADLLSNVIVLRSFTATMAISSSDAGFILANPDTIELIREAIPGRPLSTTICKTILSSFLNDEDMASQLQLLHEESLRLASALNRIGVQCRLAPADFVLLRVAHPRCVIDHLARYHISVENLEGYPQLQHYVRYRIQPAYVNDRLLDAFKRMPADHYLMKSADRLPATLRRGAGSLTAKRGRGGTPGRLANSDALRVVGAPDVTGKSGSH